ncbi:MAG TPA: hypothetical protein VED84_05695 [Acidimicrobiales bacterium]|nr:hypothetical protein [Acidimicrobiales bacterium]
MFVTVGIVIGLTAAFCGAAYASGANLRHGSCRGGRHSVTGTVTSVPSDSTTLPNSFSISTRSGSALTVDVTSTTSYVECGVTSPSLANVAQGDLVTVFGTTSGTTVAATKVVISNGQGRGPVGFGGSPHLGHGSGGLGGFDSARGAGGFGHRHGSR